MPGPRGLSSFIFVLFIDSRIDSEGPVVAEYLLLNDVKWGGKDFLSLPASLHSTASSKIPFQGPEGDIRAHATQPLRPDTCGQNFTYNIVFVEVFPKTVIQKNYQVDWYRRK